MNYILKAAIECFDPSPEKLAEFERKIAKKKAYQVSASLKPDREGSEWERRMAAFDIARKLYPGTKDGIVTEFNRFLASVHKNGGEIDNRLKALPWNIKYQIEMRERMKDASEFVPPWKNFSTWINQANWNTVNNTFLALDKWREKQHTIPEEEFNRFKIDFL